MYEVTVDFGSCPRHSARIKSLSELDARMDKVASGALSMHRLAAAKWYMSTILQDNWQPTLRPHHTPNPEVPRNLWAQLWKRQWPIQQTE
eukprot:5303262-Amphidinium_carterae.1